VFTARYALSPYIKQIRFVFKGLNFMPVKWEDVRSGPRGGDGVFTAHVGPVEKGTSSAYGVCVFRMTYRTNSEYFPNQR
jgi:hypothetical protein